MPQRRGLTGHLYELVTEPAVIFSEHSPDLQVLLKSDGSIEWVNRTWARLLGYALADVLNHPFAQFVHADDIGAFASAVRALSRGDLETRIRFRLLKKGEGYIYVGARGSYFNERRRSFLTLQDDTRSLMRERSAGIDLMQAYAGHGEYAIVEVDAHGVIKYQSPHTERILGYKPDEMLGRSAFEFVAGPDLGSARMIFAGVVGRPYGLTRTALRMRHKSGRVVLIEIVGFNLLDKPDVEAVVGFFWNESDKLGTYMGDERQVTGGR